MGILKCACAWIDAKNSEESFDGKKKYILYRNKIVKNIY